MQSAGQMKHFFDLRLRKMAGEPHPDMLMLADRMHAVIGHLGLKYPI